MKTPITIRAVPKFYLEPSVLVVEGLLRLSALHYDASCVSAGKCGGHLWGWNNCIRGPEPIPCGATARELDLTLKILEAAPSVDFDIHERFALNDFRSDLRRALTAAEEYCSDKVVVLE